MNAPANNINNTDKIQDRELIQTFAAGIGLATFAYTILSLAYLIGWARQVGMDLIIFLSAEDILISGILPTYFIGAFVVLFAISFWAPIVEFNEPIYGHIQSYMPKLRRVLLCIIVIIALADPVLKSRNYELSPEVSRSILFLFLISLILFPIAHLVATQPWRRIALFVLLIICAAGTFWVGTMAGRNVEEMRFQISLLGEREPICGTLALPPLKAGIVYFESEIRKSPRDTGAHFVPWSAIKVFQSILEDERGCGEGAVRRDSASPPLR